MCGRFTQAYSWDEVRDLYGLTDQTAPNLQPRYNIAPNDYAGVITLRKSGGRQYTEMQMGPCAELVVAAPQRTSLFVQRPC